MRKLIVVGILLCMVGCRTSHHKPPMLMPAATIESPAADLLIISAAYGSGVNFADVTNRVNDLIHQPYTKFYARPEWLDADPTPGWNKALVIEYEYQGRRHIFTAGEGGEVSAPLLIQRAQAKPKRRKHDR